MSDAVLAQLRAAVGADAVVTDPQAMAPALTDWMGRYHGGALALVTPAATAEVAAAVRACAEAGVAVVPQGGNTGLVGAATPDPARPSIVLSLARLRQARSLDAANCTMTAEAGCVLSDVHAAAAAHELDFPLHFAAEGSAQLGGALATNAGGMNVVRYGNARAHVLGLEVVLPDGRVWDGLRALRKDNTGYDLKQLFVGAEGTLGVITAAVLRLVPRPRHTLSAAFAVPDAAAALELLNRLRAAGGDALSCCELVDRAAVEVAVAHGRAREPMAAPYPTYVLFELAGGDAPERLQETVETIFAELHEGGRVHDAVLATSESQARELWALRETIADVQGALSGLIKHDVAVPVSAVPDVLAAAGRRVQEVAPGARPMGFGHLGDGNLHYNVLAPPDLTEEALRQTSTRLTRAVHELVVAYGGTISAEHGIGQEKIDELRRVKSEVELDLMRRIKTAIDPQGLMNPGKVL